MVQEKTSIAPNMQMLLFNNQMPHGMRLGVAMQKQQGWAVAAKPSLDMPGRADDGARCEPCKHDFFPATDVDLLA